MRAKASLATRPLRILCSPFFIWRCDIPYFCMVAFTPESDAAKTRLVAVLLARGVEGKRG